MNCKDYSEYEPLHIEICKHEWISVKDKLPDPKPDGFKRYIVNAWSHERKINVVDFLDWHDNSFQDLEGEKISMDDGYWVITHWMHLPEPPNE